MTLDLRVDVSVRMCGSVFLLRRDGQMTETTMDSRIKSKFKRQCRCVMLCGGRSQEQVVLESEDQSGSRWCC